ncbi:hypothetical protein ACE6H2_010605 [Prunus campanulata]
MAIANKMSIHGEKMEDMTIVEKVLRSMTTKFDYVVCSIEESNDVEQLSIDELQSSLLVHEQKINRSTSKEHALKVSTNSDCPAARGRGGRGRGRGRGGSHGRGRGSRDGNKSNDDSGRKDTHDSGSSSRGYYNSGGNSSRGRRHSSNHDSNVDKSNVECFRCGNYGHYKSECYTNMNKAKGARANFAEKEKEDDGAILMVCQTMEKPQKNVWYLDTGCSNHMCGEKSIFSTIDESFTTTVRFGDDSKVSVLGKGDIKIWAKDNTVHTISSVFFVPSLKSNLLSLGQLHEKGYEIKITGGACQIHDQKRGLIAKAYMTTNRMFPLHIQSHGPTCFSTKVNDPAWLWHLRYGHLNFRGLKTLHDKEMVIGLPQITCPSEVCEVCVVGKQHRETFPKGKAWRARRPLELVHSDICGPITPASNAGKRYFITFIDDYSRKTWVYFLQEKSEALNAFKHFKAAAENEIEKTIKVLRTDRGGEYNSKAFENFCAIHGVRRQLTAAYTPQQNGVAERKNRTILNMVRSMQTKSCIPKSFWPEAVNWSIHILNRSPTFAVRDLTPEEAWSGRKPAVGYFKVFGCIAYARIPDEKRKKLDDKGEKCVFLGISEVSKAYKLFNPVSKKIIISRDVVFDEEKTWNWSDDVSQLQQNIPVNFEDNLEQQPLEQQQPQQCIPASTLSVVPAPTSLVVPALVVPPIGVQTASSSSARPQRLRKRPAWMIDFEWVFDSVSGSEGSDDDPLVHFALFADSDPVSFSDAVREPKWQKAMDEEIKSIEKNNTWELTELPQGHKTIGVKWVFKTKLNEKGEIHKHKARLVAKGYKQEYGVDYTEVFAPVARHDTIRLVISMAAQNSWPIF